MIRGMWCIPFRCVHHDHKGLPTFGAADLMALHPRAMPFQFDAIHFLVSPDWPEL
jgi:hypothetical protein